MSYTMRPSEAVWLPLLVFAVADSGPLVSDSAPVGSDSVPLVSDSWTVPDSGVLVTDSGLVTDAGLLGFQFRRLG